MKTATLPEQDKPAEQPAPIRRRIPAKTLIAPWLIFSLVLPCFFANELIVNFTPGTWGDGTMMAAWVLVYFLGIGAVIYLPGAAATLYFARRKQSVLKCLLLPHAALMLVFAVIWCLFGGLPANAGEWLWFASYPVATSAAACHLLRSLRRY